VKLEEQLRRTIRQKGHAYNTEKAYVQKYNQFIQFAKAKYGEYRHPAELAKSDIQDFLTHLAADRNVAVETQRQALSALKFLYEHVLKIDFGILDFAPAEKPRKLPVVMTFRETSDVHVIEAMSSKLVSPLDRLRHFADAEGNDNAPPDVVENAIECCGV
jgi:site-specific recombinase XerD